MKTTGEKFVAAGKLGEHFGLELLLSKEIFRASGDTLKESKPVFHHSALLF
jgi:hypothetical protein